MATVTITKCDQCGATKGVDNHWLLLCDGTGDDLSHYTVYESCRGLEAIKDQKGVWDICGTECLKLKLNELRKPKILQDPKTKIRILPPDLQDHDPSIIQRVLRRGVQAPETKVGELSSKPPGWACSYCMGIITISNSVLWKGAYICESCYKKEQK